MEDGSTLGEIRVSWLNVGVHSCGLAGALLGVFGWRSCAGWELALSVSLSFFLSPLSVCASFLERLQLRPVLEWLQGKPNVSLAFSSFCAVYPSNPPHLFLSSSSSICCFFFSISNFYLLCLVCFTPVVFICLTSSLSHFAPPVCSFISSYNSSFGALISPLSLSFLLFSLSLSRAAYLSLQDGAIHP